MPAGEWPPPRGSAMQSQADVLSYLNRVRLFDRLQAVKLENKVLRQVSADYKRVKRVFGPEQVKAAVQADKQREKAEKAHKRSRRAFSRDGR